MLVLPTVTQHRAILRKSNKESAPSSVAPPLRLATVIITNQMLQEAARFQVTP
jgi:hypothetical protein